MSGWNLDIWNIGEGEAGAAEAWEIMVRFAERHPEIGDEVGGCWTLDGILTEKTLGQTIADVEGQLEAINPNASSEVLSVRQGSD